MENEEKRCSICGSNISLILIRDKWLCQECLIIGNEKVTILWKNHLETLVKEYTESCLSCLSADNPELVHQARVAGRKIRSILEFLGVSKKHELLLTIKKMHHLLNKVREADVLLTAMNKESEKNVVYAEMVRLVTKKRKKLQNLIIKEIPTIVNDSFINKVQTFMNSELAAYTVLFEKENVIDKYEEKFYSLVEVYQRSVEENGSVATDSIKALHAVRIQSKSLRYIYHYLNEMPGEDYQDKVDFYKDIQNQFGGINDIQNWIYQIKTYEKKIDATKSEIGHVKKKLKARLQHMIEKVELPE